MKAKRVVLYLVLFLPLCSLSTQTNIDSEQVLPAMLIGANSFESPMSSGHALVGETNDLEFVVNTPESCPREYANDVSNTNLFSLDEEKLLIEIPLEYKSTTTNSPPANSKFIGMEAGRSFWLDGFIIGQFQQTNTNAQIDIFFDRNNNGRATGIRYRTKSNDGYDVLFYNDGSIESFRGFKNGKLSGLWVDFDRGHCITWMRFKNGMAIDKWIVWNNTGSMYMEAMFKKPYDFIGHLNISL